MYCHTRLINEHKLKALIPEVLNELWVTWPEITLLDIRIIADVSFLHTSLDSIFTGIPEAALKMLRDCQTDSIDNKCVKSFPFIGQLKKLTHLLIKEPSRLSIFKLNGPDIALKVSNDPARLVLANLKDLVFLHISRDRHQISPSCVQDLCTGLGLQQHVDENVLRLVKYEWQKKIRIYD